jgi:hypothetical protein
MRWSCQLTAGGPGGASILPGPADPAFEWIDMRNRPGAGRRNRWPAVRRPCFLCGWQQAQRDPERIVSEVLDFCAMAEDDGRRHGNGKWWDALAGQQTT